VFAVVVVSVTDNVLFVILC